MNINFFKISLKTEIKNLSKKTFFLVLLCLITPFIFYYQGILKNSIQLNNFVFTIIFLLSLTAGLFQYILDSTTKDILSKVNIFYSNLNISCAYSFIAKVVLFIPIILIFFICNIIFFKIRLPLFFIVTLIILCFNICIFTYIIVTYFFNSNSMLFPTYISMFFTMGLSLITVILLNSQLNFAYNIILQIIIAIIGLILFEKIFRTKKLIIKII